MPILWNAADAYEYDYTNGYSNPTKRLRSTFDGCVLSTSVQHSVRIMSDVWADCYNVSVWNAEKQMVQDIGIGNSEFGMSATATVDATPEVRAKADLFLAVKAAADAARALEYTIEAAVNAATRIQQGKDVVVARGRKVPQGTIGRVFWTGSSQWGTRLGLELPNGDRIFVAAANCDVAQPDEYLDVDALLADRAAAAARLAEATTAFQQGV